MKVALREGDFGTFLLVAPRGQSILVQSDWDFPRLASVFGWTPCPCGTTDGTLDCEHRTVREMIAEAHDFLCAHAGNKASVHAGKRADDPGYFTDDGSWYI